MDILDIDPRTKHFGIIKDGLAHGLGIRIGKNQLEIGYFQKGHLMGTGRKLAAGEYLYIGKFMDGAFYGKGT